MSQRVVYFNGQFVPESEARVSIFDSALMYGDMAFEMTRTYNQRPFKLRDHLEAVWIAQLLEIDCGLSLDEMERITRETLEATCRPNRPTWTGRSCTMCREDRWRFTAPHFARRPADGLD